MSWWRAFWLHGYATRRQKIIELLKRDGPLPGLELVKRSGGVLKRGSIYQTLADMQDANEVVADESRPQWIYRLP